MENKTIGFIGGGNMASSLIGGLIADGFPAAQLWVADPDAERREALGRRFGVHTTADNRELTAQAEVVVMAVKPQVMREACQAIGNSVLEKQRLVISIAAGIRIEAIERWLGGPCAIVRTMPNTPSLVGSGATALFANARVQADQRELAEAMLRAVGLTLWLDDESQMDAVTAVSGSGPAYFFLMMELLENAGTSLGLKRETARLLSLQTAFGAAKLALESLDDSATLRARVTSPGGTTERAVALFEEGGLRELFEKAVSGARDRAVELADKLESEKP
ncbi:pyrroline-5-carboxylate reductase [Thiohalomonas denitrificans]|uniref:Pyrroline-5-carboxylate reductase n=1 Tax=Thiohalomonas denitrificans TaxID=415747 RepID=A0A1G5QK27_9GAMM|nr:pyrroline-5-carboxylate reductase [Thiohalomonas denitrificans]SCZ61910.1 pyrroline-5-carboxylate reductase [Thiohalomonas denitrificans]